MYRSENGTEMRLGKTLEHYATFDHQWVPHQVKRGDLVLIHDMVSFPVENRKNSQKTENTATLAPIKINLAHFCPLFVLKSLLYE